MRWKSTIVFLILTYIIIISLSPTFQTNDDHSITRILNGMYTGTHEPQVVAVNLFLGEIITDLYKLYPQFNWYSIFLQFTLLGAFSIQLLIVNKLVKSVKLLLLIHLLIFFYFTYFTLLQQFTIIAASSILSGFLIVIYFLNQKQILRSILFSVIPISLGILLRSYSFFLVLAIATPIFIWMFLKSKQQVAIIVFYLFFLISTIIFVHSHLDTDLRWKNVKLFWGNQAIFHGYNIYEYKYNPEVYAKVGWSENDYEMFVNWSYQDADIFSDEDLDYIVSSIKYKMFDGRIGLVLQSFGYSIVQYLRLIVITFLFFFVLYIYLKEKRKIVHAGLATFGMGLLIMLYYAFFGRPLPERVVYPMFLAITMFTLMYAIQDNTILSKPKFKFNYLIIYFYITIVFSFTSLIFLYSFINKQCIKQSDIISEKFQPDILYYAWNYGYRTECIHVLDNFEKYRNIDLIGIGWTQRLPPTQALLDKYGIDNLYLAFIERDDVLLVGEADRTILTTFYKEHYDMDVEYRKIDGHDNIGFYKIVNASE